MAKKGRKIRHTEIINHKAIDHEKEKVNDEVTLDLDRYWAKAKSFFSSFSADDSKKRKIEADPEELDKESTSSDDVNIDVKAALNFLKKYGMLFLLLVPLILSVSIRMQTSYLPITAEWAEDSVNQQITSQIANVVNQQYPNLPAANRNVLINEQVTEYKKQNQAQIDQQVQQVADYFKGHFQDNSGSTYMPDIDPYHFLRYARNLIEKGMVGDEVRNGVQWDNHQIAPIGMPTGTSVHPYVMAGIYEVISFFKPNISLMRAASYFPIIMTVLSIVFLFFVGRRIIGDFGSIVACIVLAINIAFLNRSLWGHSDTDSYNIFFPILIVWLFFEALSSKDNFKKRAIYSSLTGFVIGFYGIVWGGWWYMLNFVILTCFALIAINLLSRRTKDLSWAAITTGFIIVFSGIFTTLFIGFTSFFNNVTFINSFVFTQIKDVGTKVLWPNVMTTVAELNAVDLNGIISNIAIGSRPKLIFFAAMFGLVLLMFQFNFKHKYFIIGSGIWYVILGYMLKSLNKNIFFAIFLIAVPIMLGLLMLVVKKETNEGIGYSIILLIWFMGTMYASTKGIRFVLLMVPAFSIAVGALFGFAYTHLSKTLGEWIHIKHWIIKILIVVATCFILFTPIEAAYSMGKHDIPNVNDAWFNSLDKIRLESDKDAIVTSWWDFGHWFKWYTDRAVTFDGASQLGNRAHWVGKILLTDNEDLAVGILRMLHCGGEQAFNTLYPLFGNDHPKTIDVLNEIMVLEKDEAKDILMKKYGLSETDTDKMMKYTHCDPPESYFIASGDMVGKAGVWGHFGSWDFNRANMFFDVYNSRSLTEGVQLLQDKYNKTTGQAQSLYQEIKAADGDQWIAPWPSYVTGFQSCKLNGQTLECPNNIGGNPLTANVDLATGGVKIKIGNGEVIPTSIGVVTSEGVDVSKFNNSNFPYSLLLAPDASGTNFASMFMFPEFVDSMFTRMYYLKGHGLKHFDMFNYQKDITGLEIFVYKVNWAGNSTNQVYQIEQKQVVDENPIDQESSMDNTSESAATNGSKI
ncbi:hypothetical protein COV93_03600 [Candidatus Woesearchaeota archaeon CG11_big_fil_rev_8_21_14_0_20_43_8]|nr:MAG: hypothetical protein COV93_03600 [Candidatus Woesearchaeota archaeon CG11_big_fil_rev_8_21_14_0_20_43_8]PIO05363.1 MAG: hypothetical protein COT47_05145 [Candidatus Woesearchaeota archaeon CG08_land_8_20_14_0_20_43_7]